MKNWLLGVLAGVVALLAIVLGRKKSDPEKVERLEREHLEELATEVKRAHEADRAKIKAEADSRRASVPADNPTGADALRSAILSQLRKRRADGSRGGQRPD